MRMNCPDIAVSLCYVIAFMTRCLAASTGFDESGHNMGTMLLSTNFDLSITKDMWFVEFFSPYCHHCRKFAPTWASLVDMHGHLSESHNFHFGRVDCIAQGDLCNVQDIQGYPSLFIYQDGKKVSDFKDERTYEKLSEFILSNAEDHKRMTSHHAQP